MRNLCLQSLMNDLYKNLHYFARVEPDGQVAYEETYHEVAIDPDGRERNLLQEREHSLAGIKEITDFLDRSPPGKILDIGCGLGWLLSYLPNSWNKKGLEISRFASAHASNFGDIYNGTLDQYPDSGFDYIVMNHVIEHLADPISALKKIRGMLKPGGIFIIGTPDFDSAAARRYGQNFRLLHDPTHISLFSNDSMHRCLRDLGFKISHVEYPFFDTPWFSRDNLMKVLNEEGMSPPFYGSTMTFFCEVG